MVAVVSLDAFIVEVGQPGEAIGVLALLDLVHVLDQFVAVDANIGDDEGIPLARGGAELLLEDPIMLRRHVGQVYCKC